MARTPKSSSTNSNSSSSDTSTEKKSIISNDPLIEEINELYDQLPERTLLFFTPGSEILDSEDVSSTNQLMLSDITCGTKHHSTADCSINSPDLQPEASKDTRESTSKGHHHTEEAFQVTIDTISKSGRSTSLDPLTLLGCQFSGDSMIENMRADVQSFDANCDEILTECGHTWDITLYLSNQEVHNQPKR